MTEPTSAGGAGFSGYVLDDAKNGRFLVDRGIYRDPALFEAEMERIFENGWVYLCHESELARPGDYVTRHMGRQPVVVNRRKDGSIGAFANACAHRGTVVAPLRKGSAKSFTCRFHGWTYNETGRCIKIKNQETGAYANNENLRDAFGLKAVPRVESYRGFVFGSLRGDVTSLDEHLGPAKVWIDLMADQSPEGLEVLEGDSTYIIRGNWKMGGENGVDGYHVSTVHRVFAATMAMREEALGGTGTQKTEAGRIVGRVESGTVDFGNGHIGIWARRASPEAAPLYEARERLLREFDERKVDWMIGMGRNLYLFPNMLLFDQPSTQIRILRPLSPDRTEVRIQCIAPRGESAQARAARLRKFVDFYLPTGMATSDDIAALEDTAIGGEARISRWNDYGRGEMATVPGKQCKSLLDIGCEAVAASDNWDHEVFYQGYYRHWLRMMNGERR
ncbi:Rieske 2Fe-2S domain-containing protein [uncultured Pigmentiphaga sp.]|jgi:Phenylpropionate dioxygenase and related ring-hydroxylating dioxygenases, large terminal subunit|uniref:aromatic ring-hydroxylating oxygenase subunit alpha n=1 Tax=uncultured Pigmentiphaga sp. TaxID=340361 RepID=UPI00262F6B89|nr:Rieske 2Fe-2S domain-containing protein [uncultured Pigmentiphaga sp.]